MVHIRTSSVLTASRGMNHAMSLCGDGKGIIKGQKIPRELHGFMWPPHSLAMAKPNPTLSLPTKEEVRATIPFRKVQRSHQNATLYQRSEA